MARMTRERTRVRVRQPHDLGLTVDFLHEPSDPFLRREDRGTVAQAVRTSAGPALVRVSPVARDEHGHRVVALEALGPSGSHAEALAAGRRLAGLGREDSERVHGSFLRRARRDAALGPVTRAVPGLRLGQRPDPVAVVTGAILAQQVSWSFARKMTAAVWDHHGEEVTFEGVRWRLAPRAATLGRLRPESLRRFQVSGRKAEYVRDLCRDLARGDLDLPGLATMDVDAATESLVARRGVGPTTAAWILLFGAGHPDAWPPADVGLLASLEPAHDGRRPTVDEAVAWSDRFPGVRGLVALHLWTGRRLDLGARAASR